MFTTQEMKMGGGLESLICLGESSTVSSISALNRLFVGFPRASSRSLWCLGVSYPLHSCIFFCRLFASCRMRVGGGLFCRKGACCGRWGQVDTGLGGV
jgi:hypothetical protein